MKISIARGDLLSALSVVSRGLSSRSTLPILSGILIVADGETITLHATDLEVSVRNSAAARVDGAGSVVVPGKLLGDIVRTMPEAAVSIETSSNDSAVVTCAQSSFTIRTLPADDFPKFPEVTPETTATLPASIVASVVKQVGRAVSRDETRPLLTGVLLVVDGPMLKMVATDSYRLAVREYLLETAVEQNLSVIVPGRALEEVTKLAGGSGDVSIGVSENQIVFSFGKTVYISRRIEGSFPNYSALIPKSHDTRIVIDREELLEGLKRVSLLAQHNAPVKFKVTESTVTLRAQTPDVGEAVEDLMVETDGAMDVEIAFNPAFFMDGLTTPSTERIALEMSGPLKPAVITSVDGEDFLYLLMPVRLG